MTEKNDQNDSFRSSLLRCGRVDRQITRETDAGNHEDAKITIKSTTYSKFTNNHRIKIKTNQDQVNISE